MDVVLLLTLRCPRLNPHLSKKGRTSPWTNWLGSSTVLGPEHRGRAHLNRRDEAVILTLGELNRPAERREQGEQVRHPGGGGVGQLIAGLAPPSKWCSG